MAVQDYASSVQGVRMRITPLQADGTKVAAGHVLTTEGFIKASFSSEFEAGDEVTEKNAQGAVCISWKAADSLKRINFSLSVCSPDPETAQMLTGGDLLWDEDDSVAGYASLAVGDAPSQANAIEVWSVANMGGKPASGQAYWRWLFPYVQVRFDGDREFSNGALVNDFSGQGLGNDALSLSDWTWGYEDRPFSYVRTNTLPNVGWTGTPPTPPT